MATQSESFATSVLGRYNQLRQSQDVYLAKSAQDSLRQHGAFAEPFGHPRFAQLAIGETGYTNAVAVFLDLDQFTQRTFWDDPADVARLSVAVLTELARIVTTFGGHVLGLRGDGLFASFENDDPAIAAGFAVTACAQSLDATQGALNNLLELSGIEPVRLRAGADYGRLDFSRVGSDEGSEVNAVGFAANFAAKCEKLANSWELVAGEGLGRHLPDADVSSHERSPKTYTRLGEHRTYQIFNVAWRRYLPHAEGIPEQLRGRPLTALVIQ